jgi:hypothetical protein
MTLLTSQKLARWINMGGMCFLLMACQSSPTWLDQHFGQSVQAAQHQQTRHPASVVCPQHSTQDSDVRLAMPHHNTACPFRYNTEHDSDGISVKSAIEQYQQSFQKSPDRAPAIHIGVDSIQTP